MDPAEVRQRRDRLETFARSFAPFFYRKQQARLSKMYLEGLASHLHRKSVEPLAIAHFQPRQGLQRFVGQAKGEDARVRAELHRQVGRDLGNPDGILILDASGFPKKGKHSAGVARQGCNRRGKTENCQSASSSPIMAKAVPSSSMAISTSRTHGLAVAPAKTPLTFPQRSASAPRSVSPASFTSASLLGFLTPGPWAMTSSGALPISAALCLNTGNASNTVIGDLEAPSRPRPGRRGPAPKDPFGSVAHWAKATPPSAWTRLFARDGDKGPQVLDVATTRVRTRTGRKKEGPGEILLVTRRLDATPQVKDFLSNADAQTPGQRLAPVAVHPHRLEESFLLAKDDRGRDHDEVRSWVGGHPP